MIRQFTDQEVNYIMEYTGMDVAMEYPLDTTPVVFFSRSGNTIDFVTILSQELNNL
jgi:fructoselysine-6-P-deglycase FrlB-like protein